MSQRLVKALEAARELPHITLERIVDRAEEEALLILCLVSILPFMQPIPIPGLSSILGLIILLQGIGLTFKGKPLLTKKMRELSLTHEKFEIILKAAKKFTHITAKISMFKHPLVSSRFSQIICGMAIIFSAAFLSLPLPIPLSNFIPALSIFLICVGLLEDDLMLVILGLGITIAVIWMAMLSYGFIREQFLNWV